MRTLSFLLAVGLALAGAASVARAQLPLPPPAPVTQLEVTFDFSQGVVRLDVDLGGTRAARLVLDTGNASSVLDLDAAKSFGLPLDPAKKKKMGTEADAPDYYLLTPEHVRLGSTTFTGNAFAVSPVSQMISETYGVTCDGTLGYGFFKGCVLQIDYPGRKLRLLGSAPAATAAAAPVPVVWRPYQKGTPPVIATDRLRVGGHAVLAQIDTFFAGSLVLFPGRPTRWEVTSADNVPAIYYNNVKLPAARLRDSVTLAGNTFPANGVVYSAGKETHPPQTDIAVVLGNAFFQGSVLTLDLKKDQIFVTPSRDGS